MAREFFIKEFADVLMSPQDFKDGKQLKTIKGDPMTIHAKPDAKPFAIHTPRSIPIAWRDAVKKELDTKVLSPQLETKLHLGAILLYVSQRRIETFASPLICHTSTNRSFEQHILFQRR